MVNLHVVCTNEFNRTPNPKRNKPSKIITCEVMFSTCHVLLIFWWRVKFDCEEVDRCVRLTKVNDICHIKLKRRVHPFVSTKIGLIEPNFTRVVHAFKKKRELFANHSRVNIESVVIPPFILLHPFDARHVSTEMRVINLTS